MNMPASLNAPRPRDPMGIGKPTDAKLQSLIGHQIEVRSNAEEYRYLGIVEKIDMIDDIITVTCLWIAKRIPGTERVEKDFPTDGWFIHDRMVWQFVASDYIVKMEAPRFADGTNKTSFTRKEETGWPDQKVIFYPKRNFALNPVHVQGLSDFLTKGTAQLSFPGVARAGASGG